MLNTLKNAWQIPELRKKLMFTLLMLFVFRIGAFIPSPQVDSSKLHSLMQQNQLAGMFDLFSGGAFSYATIFAMSVTPYINSSIILQLLGVAIPSLEKLQKEGQEGRKKIAEYTRYLTVILAAIQAIGIYIALTNYQVVKDPGLWSAIIIILSLTAGTSFLMWVGEKITEKGIGNGMSLLIFTGIVSRFPQGINQIIIFNQNGQLNAFTTVVLLAAAVAVICFVIFFDKAERKIPVQYPRRVVGRTAMGGQISYMPLKVNLGGVIPIIFAMSLTEIPIMLKGFVTKNPGMTKVLNFLSTDSVPGAIIYALLILFFTYFYASIMFNTEDVADNMKQNGAFIPGVRQGKDTVEFLNGALSRITLIGAIFLVLVALLPILVQLGFGLQIWIGSTSLLIVVGVALETVRQLEAQMSMKRYRGFLD